MYVVIVEDCIKEGILDLVDGECHQFHSAPSLRTRRTIQTVSSGVFMLRRARSSSVCDCKRSTVMEDW